MRAQCTGPAQRRIRHAGSFAARDRCIALRIHAPYSVSRAFFPKLRLGTDLREALLRIARGDFDLLPAPPREAELPRRGFPSGAWERGGIAGQTLPSRWQGG